ncbi:MAG TPA: hypothetical protein VNO30_10765 [Kofleriaceae bacterium]|nr:hypothetical protein [Kofleriaceae bacterium]
MNLIAVVAAERALDLMLVATVAEVVLVDVSARRDFVVTAP